MGLGELPFEELYMRVYNIVAQIPIGKVATYGQVAQIVGSPCTARRVGWALRALPRGLQVPWQRVINSRGTISAKYREEGARLQRRLLEEEGIEFDAADRTDLRRFQWEGPSREWLQAHGYPLPPDDEPDPSQLELF